MREIDDIFDDWDDDEEAPLNLSSSVSDIENYLKKQNFTYDIETVDYVDYFSFYNKDKAKSITEEGKKSLRDISIQMENIYKEMFK